MPFVVSALHRASSPACPRHETPLAVGARRCAWVASLLFLGAATHAAVAADVPAGPLGVTNYTIGGTVGGMVGTDLVLALNGGNNLLVTANGAFVFPQAQPDLSSYAVTIVQQPIDPNQVCTVINGSGMLAGGNVTNVVVDCAPLQPHLVLSVDDGHAYARYGLSMSYIVTLTNDGTGDASGVSLVNVSPPQIDAPGTSWSCIGAGTGATCTASGTGALSDSGIALPVGRSLTWLVLAPVRMDLVAGETLDYTVDASGAGTASATDSDILVLLRTGMDVPYGDGAE